MHTYIYIYKHMKCIDMCMYMYICVDTCLRIASLRAETPAAAATHANVFTHIYIYIYIYVNVYIYEFMYVYIYIHIYICKYIYMNMYMYIYIHICLFICIQNKSTRRDLVRKLPRPPCRAA